MDGGYPSPPFTENSAKIINLIFEPFPKGKEETYWNYKNEGIKQQMCKTPNYWCRIGIYTDNIGEKRQNC